MAPDEFLAQLKNKMGQKKSEKVVAESAESAESSEDKVPLENSSPENNDSPENISHDAVDETQY
jgi:molybdopterin converting factor small subunit